MVKHAMTCSKKGDVLVQEFFDGIPAVTYQGSYANHPFAFRFYDPERIVAGRPMREHFCFALPLDAVNCFGLEGGDALLGSMELLNKLGVPYYTLTDSALAGEGGSLRERNVRLDEMAEAMLCLQETFGVQALRVAADLSHPRYCYGAATSYSADIYAFAAAQVKKSLELAHRLESKYFCFFGGQETRSGFYATVNDSLESENLLRLLARLHEHAGTLGYKGKLCVQPGAYAHANIHGETQETGVPEPYWPSAAHALAFLRYGTLDEAFRVDMPVTGRLSDLRMLLQAERLGLMETRPVFGGNLVPMMTHIQLELLRAGTVHGMVLDLQPKFAATPEDYMIHCIMNMDACACGLLLAQRILLDGRVDQFHRERYGEFGYGLGQMIINDQADFAALEEHALVRGEVHAATNRLEYIENVFQNMLCRGI